MSVYIRIYSDEFINFEEHAHFKKCVEIIKALEQAGIDGIVMEGLEANDQRKPSINFKFESVGGMVWISVIGEYVKTGQLPTVEQALAIAKFLQGQGKKSL